MLNNILYNFSFSAAIQKPLSGRADGGLGDSGLVGGKGEGRQGGACWPIRRLPSFLAAAYVFFCFVFFVFVVVVVVDVVGRPSSVVGRRQRFLRYKYLLDKYEVKALPSVVG